MKKHDIVYILKQDAPAEDLIYSVRSVVKNFPYRKIWFYCGCPEGIRPDNHVEFVQQGANKWDRVNNTLRAICENDDITPDFWLFNDDFYVMKKVSKLEPMVDGTLWMKANKIARENDNRDSKYSNQLRNTARILRDRGYDRLNYALHVPMLINREKGLKTLNEFQGYPMFRSLYGNHHRIGGIITDDVKIQSVVDRPTGDEIFISTDDTSFREGAVGAYIREAFPDECKYEIKG